MQNFVRTVITEFDFIPMMLEPDLRMLSVRFRLFVHLGQKRARWDTGLVMFLAAAIR